MLLFEMNGDGRYRIVKEVGLGKDKVRMEGAFVPYTSIATLHDENKTYVAFTQYWDGVQGLKPETVYELKEITEMQDKREVK